MIERFAAIVIAAGESRRMGTPKQLLPWHGRTFIEQIVSTLLESPLDEIVVVLGHRADEIRAQIPNLTSADATGEGQIVGPVVRALLNPRYTEGMLTTIQCGIAALGDDVRAAYIALVDQPQIKASTLATLRQQFEAGGKGIVVPSHQMRRGHPLLIDLRKYRAEILAIDGPPGLQKLLRSHPDDILHVNFDDASVLADLDTPEDYRRAIQTLPE
jgi:molybdenum cofactor cytidylyltransferase